MTVGTRPIEKSRARWLQGRLTTRKEGGLSYSNMCKTDEKPILLGYWPGKRWKQARAVFDRGGLSPTLTAQMGGKHNNNFVYVMEESNGEERH